MIAMANQWIGIKQIPSSCRWASVSQLKALQEKVQVFQMKQFLRLQLCQQRQEGRPRLTFSYFIQLRFHPLLVVATEKQRWVFSEETVPVPKIIGVSTSEYISASPLFSPFPSLLFSFTLFLIYIPILCSPENLDSHTQGDTSLY